MKSDTRHYFITRCDIHPNQPANHPIEGCKTCWYVWHVRNMLALPPEKWGEYVSAAEMSAAGILELERKGQAFQFHKPQITIEKV